MIATSGILIQQILLEMRWAEDVMYFDIEYDTFVHGTMIKTVNLTLKGWSWDRDSFVVTKVS